MLIKMVSWIVGTLLCCSTAYSNTMTFDEVPSGTVLWESSYGFVNRVIFQQDFRVTDHTNSTWGVPHSGSNVVTSVGSPYGSSSISFGNNPLIWNPDHIQSVGAYFSTEMDKMVRIVAYRRISGTVVQVDSAVIGAPGESWNNRYVELSAAPGTFFEKLVFFGVNSPDELQSFCLDDMTITPVPEPSSLAALGFGFVPMAAAVRLRRRKG